MGKPTVTVIIAHKDYQHFLGDAINSALSQKGDFNLKVCVVDDGSEDWFATAKILEENGFLGISVHDFEGNNYWNNGNNYTIRLDKSLGPSGARNAAIKHLWDSTDYFAILDADDKMLPNKIQKCLNVFAVAPQHIGVVYGDCEILNTTSGQVTREYREPYTKERLNRECIVHSGAMVSKLAMEHTVEKTGYYDETMRTCEDYDLWMRISEKFVIFHIPEALTLVRVQPQNSSATVDKSIWQDNWKKVMQKAYTRNNG